MQILQEQKSASAKDGVNADFAGAKICPCCRNPRQAYSTPFLISKLGIAVIVHLV
ncbi:hypothetical protein [Methylotuvimicrobium buryatense]|uniref:hypothetical protein n=1 Tax=Methylotuvimicrobium buryatense TaxID=95641 RepID=UPI0015868C2D|nr:hypothetical protein [Methylotuvimicrobium buryatense]